jgi:metal-dependent hydrolase (beta-lactamase superfamily II)
MDRSRPRGIVAVAALMIVFGCAEVATAFTHHFFGLHTAAGELSTGVGAVLGVFYATAGLLVLTGRRLAAIAAIVLLAVIVVGRAFMIVAGLYPIGSFKQAAAIAAGTAIAAGFAVYVGWKMPAFE